MTTRTARCSCGQPRLVCSGEPVRISICHCLACQQRTGSVFGTQARFHRDHVVIDGRSTPFMRVGDSGDTITFHFCPLCGSTVYWQIGSASDLIAVAVGSFADAHFPEPRHSVYERRRHAWGSIQENAYMEHLD